MRWVAPVALAVVFAWAGGAKFADREATVEGFRALGLSSAEQRSIQVPAVEIATAVLLVVAPVGGAIVALVFLLVFTVILANRLVAGSRVPCRCFGNLRTRPISWLDVLRNIGLAALAVVTAVLPPV